MCSVDATGTLVECKETTKQICARITDLTETIWNASTVFSGYSVNSVVVSNIDPPPTCNLKSTITANSVYESNQTLNDISIKIGGAAVTSAEWIEFNDYYSAAFCSR